MTYKIKKNKTYKTAKKKQKKKYTFTRKEYMSGDGMMTSIWGPAMWHALHTISFDYPVHPTSEEKKHYKEYIESLKYVLPCKYCRTNLTNNLKIYPIRECHMKNRDTFSRYVYKGKEQGCTAPLYGKDAKCVIKIVPEEEKEPSFSVDNRCVKVRG